MSFKTLFGALAVSLGHLKAAGGTALFEDQQRALDATIQQLRDAEAGIGDQVAADVNSAIGAALADPESVLNKQLAALQASIDGINSVLAEAKAASEIAMNSIEQFGQRLVKVEQWVAETDDAANEFTGELDALEPETPPADTAAPADVPPVAEAPAPEPAPEPQEAPDVAPAAEVAPEPEAPASDTPAPAADGSEPETAMEGGAQTTEEPAPTPETGASEG